MEYLTTNDLAALSTLRAVVELGGVKQAAQALHVGQPAISKRIRALETGYQDRLVERVSGRLRLTEAGEKVYLFAVQTLDRQRELLNQLQLLREGKQTLRIEVTLAIGEQFLSELLLRFRADYPDYQIESRLAYGRQIEAHLATGLADMALLESAPDHPDILVQKWMEDELLLVCGADHELSQTDYVDIQRVADFDFVLRERRSSVRDALDENLTRIGAPDLKVQMEVGATETIIDMLESGRYLSFLPRFAVGDEIQSGKLHHIRMNQVRMLRTLWIARHRSRLDLAAADAFIEVVRGLQ